MKYLEILEESVNYFGGFKSSPAPADTSRYMRGWCPYFALALHQLYGFEIFGMGAHFLTRRPDGMYVDIRGVMTEDQAKSGISNTEMYLTTSEELISEIDFGDFKCGFFSQNDLDKAKKLVKKLIE
jgi:hypothetical protein